MKTRVTAPSPFGHPDDFDDERRQATLQRARVGQKIGCAEFPSATLPPSPTLPSPPSFSFRPPCPTAPTSSLPPLPLPASYFTTNNIIPESDTD
ncbi:hypothetical protein Mapa_006673 [Marchantia paleacea]|nr:hypothetical protein Mapa_006673 [Marchantia paleacea]